MGSAVTPRGAGPGAALRFASVMTEQRGSGHAVSVRALGEPSARHQEALCVGGRPRGGRRVLSPDTERLLKFISQIVNLEFVSFYKSN